MDYELINFSPERTVGTLFSGWFHAKTRRAVFVPRMMHFQSVMNDGDRYDATDEDVGENYRIPRGRINGLNPEEIYGLMFSEGWVRFYTEHGADATLVMEGHSEKVLQGAARFAAFAGHNKNAMRLRIKDSYGGRAEPVSEDFTF